MTHHTKGILLTSLVLVSACGRSDSIGDGARAVRSSQSGHVSDARRYIVGFRDVAQGKAALGSAGASVVLELGPQNAAAARIPDQALIALQNNPHIEYIEPDAVRMPLAQVVPYGIELVQANQLVYTEGATPNPASAASGRKVCIIDSGYYRGHEDLGADAAYVTGTNVSGTGNWFEDTCGHGTHVAGTISALDNDTGVIGVVPTGNLKLHIIKVFDGAECAWTYSSNLVNAANLCEQAGANIISMSLGGGRKTRTEETAFKGYESRGILSIAAAGNDGTAAGGTVDALSYPASYATVMSVAAVDENRGLATFSQENSAVEIAAPGVAVASTLPFRETNTLTVDASVWAGHHVEGSARGQVSGELIDGGQCTAADSAWANRVVLCQRGTVSFNDKVVNVKNSGGVAAVIYNNDASDPTCAGLFATLGTGVTSTITALGLSCAQGAEALLQVGMSSTVLSSFEQPASGYDAWNGTSMATPHVSAVAALVWSQNTSWSNLQIREALTRSALDLGTPGRDISFGYGLVQAKAAADYALATFGSGGGSSDTTAPVISKVTAVATNSKRGAFKITWTTDEAADSSVTFVQGASTTVKDSALVTSHSISISGVRGVLYQYFVTSRDAVGNSSSSPVMSFQN